VLIFQRVIALSIRVEIACLSQQILMAMEQLISVTSGHIVQMKELIHMIALVLAMEA
jgi:hypothetical protein